MQIRPIGIEEMERSAYLGSQAFRHGHYEPYVPDPDPAPRDIWGVYDDRGLQARVVVIPFQTHLGPEAVVPMAGVAGVACLPASRGKGYVGRCLDYSLEQMREKGQVISMLFPFAWEFYRRYGWEWVGRTQRYTAPTSILKADPATEQVRAAEPEDYAAVQDCYARYAGRYRGMTRRSERHWKEILEDSKDRHTFTYLYEQEGRIEGYLTYRGGNREHTELREFLTLTERARRGLMGLLRRHDMQVEKFGWDAPPDDVLWSQLNHWDLQTKIGPATQARVVDLAGALQAWRPRFDLSGEVTLAVQDEHAPWNTGIWRVQCEAGRIEASAGSGEPQVSLDIQALTQAYFGTPDLDEVRRAERLTVHDEAGYVLLRDLLAGPPMFINDGF